MSVKNESKINQLLQEVPAGAVYLTSWMKQNNIPHSTQHRYVESAWREYRQHFHHIIEVGNVVILRSEVQTLHKRPFRGRDRQLENPLSGGGDSCDGIEYFGGKQPERHTPVVFSEPKR